MNLLFCIKQRERNLIRKIYLNKNLYNPNDCWKCCINKMNTYIRKITRSDKWWLSLCSSIIISVNFLKGWKMITKSCINIEGGGNSNIFKRSIKIRLQMGIVNREVSIRCLTDNVINLEDKSMCYIFSLLLLPWPKFSTFFLTQQIPI